ncbi:MAG: outer membrane protein assembly factor BamE [bacterium]
MKTKNHILAFGAACALLVLAACNNQLTPQNLEKVQTGMTSAEVHAILGKPTEVKTSDMGFTSGTVNIYRKNNAEVQIIFLNDHVITKNGEFK